MVLFLFFNFSELLKQGSCRRAPKVLIQTDEREGNTFGYLVGQQEIQREKGRKTGAPTKSREELAYLLAR